MKDALNKALDPHWPVWDRPVRVIHWYFPLAVTFMWWTREEGYMQWHSWCGYSLLVVVLTRLTWGFFGSHYARFTQFIESPITVWRYVRGADFDGVGHNPVGGYSTLILLLLITVQGLTGLASSDDILFEGPLAYWAADYSSTLTEWHTLNWLLLVSVIVVHVFAIAFYSLIRKQKLIIVMWRGYEPGRISHWKPVNAWWAFSAAIVWSLLLAAVITLAPQAPSYY